MYILNISTHLLDHIVSNHKTFNFTVTGAIAQVSRFLRVPLCCVYINDVIGVHTCFKL